MDYYSYRESASITKAPPPTDRNENCLTFDEMDPKMFERLCCDLLWEIYESENTGEILEILPIGKEGHTQGGADIFTRTKKGNIHLYEVKRVRKYSYSLFTKTIDRFLSSKEKWHYKPSKFGLFVSSELDQVKIEKYMQYTDQKDGIDFEIITPSKINELLRNQPMLVYKYFHAAWVEMLFGTSGLWHATSYGYYNFKETPGWEGYEQEYLNIFGSTFRYRNEHIGINGFLPGEFGNTASCLIELRNGKFSHILITLTHKQLLETYFRETHQPIQEGVRSYVIKNTFSKVAEKAYYVDLGNCRIELSKKEVSSIYTAFDKYSEAYLSAAKNLESKWKINSFNAYPSMPEHVPLMVIKRGLWHEILQFSWEHDTFEKNSDWSIFNTVGRERLTVWTDNMHSKFGRSYHATIVPFRNPSSFWCTYIPDDEILLTYQIPSDNNLVIQEDIVGEKHLWDAEFSFSWLKDELIPKVLNWSTTKSKHSQSLKDWFKRVKKAGDTRDDYDPSRYLREKTVSKLYTGSNNEILNMDLREIVAELQSFYASCRSKIFIPAIEMKNLYELLSVIVRGADSKDFRFIHSSVNYLNATDMNDLANKSLDYALSMNKGSTNSMKIECVFRSILAAIKKSHAEDPTLLRAHIPKIIYFVTYMNDIRLLDKQTHRANN